MTARNGVGGRPQGDGAPQPKRGPGPYCSGAPGAFLARGAMDRRPVLSGAKRLAQDMYECSGGKGMAPPFRRRHRRTLSQDSAMSTCTPRSLSRGSAMQGPECDTATSMFMRSPTYERTVYENESHFKSVRHESVAYERRRGESVRAAKLARGTPVPDDSVDQGKTAELQREIESLRCKLAEADAKYATLDSQFRESSKMAISLQGRLVEQAGMMTELEAKLAVESHRAEDLNTELMVARDEILQLNNSVNAKDDAIKQLEGCLASATSTGGAHDQGQKREDYEAGRASRLGDWEARAKELRRKKEERAKRAQVAHRAELDEHVPDVQCAVLSRELVDKTQEICYLREELQVRHHQLMLVEEEAEAYKEDMELRLAAMLHELKDEKLRCKMLQETLDKFKARRRSPRQHMSTDKAARELEQRLTEAKAKAVRMRGVAKTAGAILSTIAEGMHSQEVNSIESLLADAISIADSLLKTCGPEKTGSASPSGLQVPSDAELEATGVPGLRGMVEELRSTQHIGHHNPKQNIQYHIRLKQELEELRRECARLLREKFQLENCVRYLAARSQLYEGFCVGRDVTGRHERQATDELRPSSLASNVLYSTPLGKNSHKRAGRGVSAGKGSPAQKKNRTISECEIRDVQMETLQEAAALLGEMSDQTRTFLPEDWDSPASSARDEPMTYRDNYSHPPRGRERKLLQTVAAICMPACADEDPNVGRPLVLEDDSDY